MSQWLTPSVVAGPSRGTRALNSPLPPPGAALARASVLRFDIAARVAMMYGIAVNEFGYRSSEEIERLDEAQINF
jgi:hypothetical protein